MPQIYAGLSRDVLMSASFASIGALMFGIDNGWWGVALGLQPFLRTFGSRHSIDSSGAIISDLSTSEKSTGTSLGQAGIMLGCALATLVNRYFGRRSGVAVMSVIALIGILIQITAAVNGGRYWQLVAGKLINSVSMGLAANVVPMYMGELSPPRWRGAIVNLYQAVQVVGVVIATALVYGLSTRDTNVAFLAPIGLQFVAPVLLLVGVAWMPESPRWLVWQGRTDEARQVLHDLHASDSTYSADTAVRELVHAFELEKATRKPSLLDVFKSTDRRRALIAIGVQCLQQAQGSAYMTNYIVLFLVSLGMTDVFSVVMILYCVYLVAILGSFWLPDRVGRRPMLIGGAVVCASCMFIVSSLNIAIVPSTDASRKAALGMIFIWYFFFGLCWSPGTWLLTAEVASTRAREPTLSLATFSGFSVGLIVTLVSPYIQDEPYGNLGGSIGYIWGGFTAISVLFTWFAVPELRGLSLERIDYLFARRVPTRQFQSYKGDAVVSSPYASSQDAESCKEEEA